MRARYRRVGSLVLLMCLAGTLQGCLVELYQSIKADLDFTLEPQARDQLKAQPEVLAIYYAPRASLSAQGEASRYDPIPLEDPLLTVKDRFLAAMHEEWGLTNLRAMEAPRFRPSQMQYGVSVRELVRVYGHGLVLDFQTGVWALTVYGDEKWWQWNMTTHYSPALLAYTVRARLLDLDQRKLLWQTTCYVRTERHRAEEWVANQNQLVTDKREDLAARCAQQLIDKFLEKPPRANASPAQG